MEQVLPLELVQKCVDSEVFVIMKDHREFKGVLKGFDDFINIVLSDVTEM